MPQPPALHFTQYTIVFSHQEQEKLIQLDQYLPTVDKADLTRLLRESTWPELRGAGWTKGRQILYYQLFPSTDNLTNHMRLFDMVKEYLAQEIPPCP
jgi:hypothetical protein